MHAFSVYCASKAAVRRFARTWILDLAAARSGSMLARARRTRRLAALAPTDEVRQEVIGSWNRGALGPHGDPDEDADAALFLASERVELRHRGRAVCRRRRRPDLDR